MVEVKRILRRIFVSLAAVLPAAGWLYAQQPAAEPRIAGLETNEEYMSLLRDDGLLQQREDSVVNAVEGLRGRLRENPAEREALSQDILRLEGLIFDIRNAKGRLVDRINAIEQEWVLANLDRAVSGSPAGEDPAAEIPDSLKVRNLAANRYFRDHLPAADHAALLRAQRLELRAVDYVNRYFVNYNTLSELVAAYAAAQTEQEAMDIFGRYTTLQGLNRTLADSLAEAWNYIFDNKSYAYGYLLDRLGREDILAREEERLAEASRQLSALHGQTASEELADYFLRKRVAVDYEKAVAGVLGLDAARDSLDGVSAQLEAVEFRLPKLEVAERFFLDYDSVAFSKTPVYSYKNPIPECKVYARGTIYRILLGRFNTKRAADLFRGAYPLCYLVDEQGKWSYYAGGFATREEAEHAQKLLKERGFVRPEIVMWTDGEARNLTRDPMPETAYRVEIEGAESLSDSVKQVIAQQADGRELSRVGHQLFVVGLFDDRALADRLAAAIAQTDAELKIKVAEMAELPN